MAATILIADDDAVQRRLVENMVQRCGYETLVVDSGDAAIGTRGIALPLRGRDGSRHVAHVLPLTSGARRSAGIGRASCRERVSDTV